MLCASTLSDVPLLRELIRKGWKFKLSPFSNLYDRRGVRWMPRERRVLWSASCWSFSTPPSARVSTLWVLLKSCWRFSNTDADNR